MDLSFRTIHNVVHPTAAFSRPEDDDGDGEKQCVEFGGGMDDAADVDPSSRSDGSGSGSGSSGSGSGSGSSLSDHRIWARSQLNPKNRINSLSPVSDPLWRIDGSTGFGTQFFAIPLFMGDSSSSNGRSSDTGLVPMRIDVFIHEGAKYSNVLRSLLDLDKAFHIKDAERLRQLGVTQHLLRILQWHTCHADGGLHADVLRELFQRGPFGSRIVIENLGCHIHESRIVISHNYPLEADLLSYRELSAMWGITEYQEQAGQEGGRQMPPEVDIGELRLVQQLADSICLVNMRGRGHSGSHGGGHGNDDNVVVLKSLTSGVKYMYHELRALLVDIPPHENVISRPLFIVSKRCRFGGKRGVIGFILPYHTAGSLRDLLPLLRIHGQLTLRDQMRWSVQLARAMRHVWTEGHSFYPDLRLDNIVLSAPISLYSGEDDGVHRTRSSSNVIMIDFEQRGVWCGFSAPEVNFIEDLRILAEDDSDADDPTPEEVHEHYQRQMVQCWKAATGEGEGRGGGGESGGDISNNSASSSRSSSSSRTDNSSNQSWTWTATTIGRLERESRYSNPAKGYNVPWICLTEKEQENAMVYMLGRVLWCIFEGMSAPDRGAVWQSYRREPDIEFPEFRQTPAAIQDLISRCSVYTSVTEQNMFVRVGSRLYMKVASEDDDGHGEGDHGSNFEDFKDDGAGEGDSGSNADDGGMNSRASIVTAELTDTLETLPRGNVYRLVSDHLPTRARRFWRKRLAFGKAWLQERNRRLLLPLHQQGSSDQDSNHHGRLTLNGVCEILEREEAQLE